MLCLDPSRVKIGVMPRAAASPIPAPPRPYHHGHLRESLLDAADAWLATQDAAALTLRELAKAAGVSHAAPYHHFPSLEHLRAAVAARAFERLADAMSAAAAPARTTATRLLAICDAYVATARERPAQFRLMFGPLLARKAEHPALAAAAARAFGVLAQASLAHDPRGGVELALTGWSLAHGAAHLLIDGVLSDLPLPAGVPVPRALDDPRRLVRRLAERVLLRPAGGGTIPGPSLDEVPHTGRRRGAAQSGRSPRTRR
jgi:AcrR family transcriptional regulator